MKTIRDSLKEKLNAEAVQEMKLQNKTDKIVKMYRDELAIGYNAALQCLINIGYSEVEADDLLVPINA